MVATILVAGILALQAEPPPPTPRHPNLLLTPREIEETRERIRKHDWAARLFDKVKAMADQGAKGDLGAERNLRETALTYVLTSDARYGEAVRRSLVHDARYSLKQFETVDLKATPEFAAWGHWGLLAWAYDLTYDRYSDDERRLVERWLRAACKIVIEGERLWSTTANLVFGKHFNVGLVGFCLGDKELIDWGLNDPGAHGPRKGGFYPVIDTMVKDGLFWDEAPIYALHYDIHGMLALAEAALRYDGTDLYGYVSKKSGGSIRSLIDGYIRLAFPPEKTGIGGGSLRMATFGDGSTSFSPLGVMTDTFLVNPITTSKRDVTFSGELELAYKRYRDPGYAWLLQLNPDRDGNVIYGRAALGYTALIYGEALPDRPAPPPAPCASYPGMGIAVLRSDESAKYWSGGTTAIVRTGVRMGHGHEDYFGLVLHGRGRLLYPDINVIQYEPNYLGWTREGIGHNTLLIDRQSPRAGASRTRSDFAEGLKFFAVQGSSFQDVSQCRALAMTPEYVVDVFRAEDSTGRPRTMDWVLHGLGRLYPGNPAAYRASGALIPDYWWIENERSRTVDGSWQADWVQRGGGATPGAQRLGPEWFQQTAGVRVSMLGAAGTTVYCGEGPLTNGAPYGRIDGAAEGSSPMLVVRRQAPSATFAAVHEPHEGRPAVQRVTRLDETAHAVGLAIEADAFSDRVLVAFDDGKEQTLRGPDGESFTFLGHGYVRKTAKDVIVRGRVTAFRLRAGGETAVRLNGAVRDGEFLVFGTPGRGGDGTATAGDPAEQGIALHPCVLPEEIHLAAGRERTMSLRVRAVGSGRAQGRLRLEGRRGITTEPESVDVAGMAEGEERVVEVRVRAAADCPGGLFALRINPSEGAVAAPLEVPLSVGVVMQEDRRLPRMSQVVVRAPGYTMKVDVFSGVSYSLLDGDGHRRHGPIYNTNFIYGIPGVFRGDKPLFRYRYPANFLWKTGNTIDVGCEGSSGDHDARLRYTFHEDRIVLGLIPPTDPYKTNTVWLGVFDALESPRHNGTAKAPHEGIVADTFYFPHPLHRQGLLLKLPEGSTLKMQGGAVNFPLKLRQEVVLRFVTPDELPAGLK